jgi:lipoprotein-releasing system ATP-binding protein
MNRRGGEVPAGPLLRTRDLRKTYVQGKGTKVEVLKGVELVLEAGESVAVLGQSGVGKSTLLHLLGGLDRATSGRVEFQGRDLFAMGDAELARWRNAHIGFVFQFHHLLPEFSALENLMMPGLIARHGFGRARRRAAELLESVGLSHRSAHRVGELSGGEQQRIAVARALYMSPDLLLADEPTGNLDERTADKVHQLLDRLNRDDSLTMVVVTHNPQLAQVMGRQLTMVDGVIAPSDKEGS